MARNDASHAPRPAAIRRVLPPAALVLVAAACAWAVLGSRVIVAPDEMLILEDRVRPGPATVWTPPWKDRRVLPRRATVSVELPGPKTVHPPTSILAVLGLEFSPWDLDAPGRRRLIQAGDLASWIRPEVLAAMPDWPREHPFQGFPGRVTAAVVAALRENLPAGVRITEMRAEHVRPAEEVRVRALQQARSEAPPPLARRVLYVGLDGADWRIAEALMKRGRLPNLRRLMGRGVRADLVAFEPMMSPLLWTTAVTGRTPDAHGIFDFTLRAPDGRLVPITSRMRRSPALWEILSTWGVPSAFVNFWATYPAEQIQGVLISDLARTLLKDPEIRDPSAPGVSWPPEAAGAFEERWTTEDVPYDVFRAYAPRAGREAFDEARRLAREGWKPAAKSDADPSASRKPPALFLLELAAMNHNLEAQAKALLRRDDLALVGVYFGALDQVGHNFQHLAPPPHPLAPDEERRRYGDVVENTYAMVDAILGRLVQAAGPEAMVFIHSDHGFRWGDDRPSDVLPYTSGQPVEWHRLQGIFLAAGGPVRRGVRVRAVHIEDIAPTLLFACGVPPSEEMPGEVRMDLFGNSRAPEPSRTTSWDLWVSDRRYPQVEEAEASEARREAVEQLRALGYVGGADLGGGGEPSIAPDSTAGEPRVTYFRNRATWLLNHDRFAEAEMALLQANALEPLPKTYSLLAEARAAFGDVDGALEALEEGLDRFPDGMPNSAILWLVELYLRRGDAAGARTALQRLGAGDEDSASLRVARARLAEAEGRSREAIRQYWEALERDPREVRAAERLAALDPSSRPRLEPYLLRALERDPRIEVYWRMLGLLRSERGDAAGAAAAFHRAAELEPAEEDLRLAEAAAWVRAGRPERALAVYEALAESGTRRVPVWINLGSLRARRGDWEGALRAWRRARELGASGSQVDEAIAEAERRLSG